MAKSDWILDFKVALELSHQDASEGSGVGLGGGCLGGSNKSFKYFWSHVS